MGSGANPLINLLPIILIFVIFYFLLIRPQQQKQDQHTTMLKGLQRGDKVITAGGIIGTINKIESDDYLIVDIADNVRVKVLRSTISELADKPAAPAKPVADKKD